MPCASDQNTVIDINVPSQTNTETPHSVSENFLLLLRLGGGSRGGSGDDPALHLPADGGDSSRNPRIEDLVAQTSVRLEQGTD